MKNIVRQGKNMASQAGAGLGFNTHAHRVRETKKIVDGLKNTSLSPTERVVLAKKTANEAPKATKKTLQTCAKANNTVKNKALPDAAERELTRRRTRNRNVVNASLLAAGAGTLAVGGAVETIRDRKHGVNRCDPNNNWESAAKKISKSK